MVVAETVKENKNEEAIQNETIKKNNKKLMLPIILIVVMFIFIGTFSTAFALVNMFGDCIIPGISINGIDVSGLTKQSAINKIQDSINKELEKDISLVYDDFSTTIKPTQFEFAYNIEEAINIAYQKGREENIIKNNYKIISTYMNNIEITLNYTYNSELLQNILGEVEQQLPEKVEQPTYYIKDGNIILSPGKAGWVIDKQKLEEMIIETIKNKKIYAVEIPVKTVEPSQIDVEGFRQLIYVEPQNAYYTTEPFEVHEEVIGVDFNVEEVKQMLKEKQEQYIIKLIYTIPEFTKNQIGTEAFPDLLSSFSTKYNASDRDRTTNLKLASNSINGIVLMPGEEFSYNTVLGPRTAARGYKNAKIFSNGEVVDGIGGGICQISSTLYNAVLYANLEITQRRNHQFVTSYLKAGLDATVVYGSQDFKFKNSRKYPIKIVSQVSGGVAKIEIYGKKEDVEYGIKLSASIVEKTDTSIKSVTYMYKYLEGNEVDKILLSRDTYKRK